jgi:hypothetical protein
VEVRVVSYYFECWGLLNESCELSLVGGFNARLKASCGREIFIQALRKMLLIEVKVAILLFLGWSENIHLLKTSEGALEMLN